MNKSEEFTTPARLAVEYLSTTSLTPDPKNARKHTAKQITKLASIIAEFDWSSPIVIDEANMILAGHARHAAAKSLGMDVVPCVRLTHLTRAQKKALAVADNAMTDASSFDDGMLRDILIELTDLEFDTAFTGLEMGTIDFMIDGPAGGADDPADIVSAPDRVARSTTRPGDLWLLGKHRLLCGNALEGASYERLLEGRPAAMIFTDPPYNVPVMGHVSGLGRNQHPEFAMASGEMSDEEYQIFLGSFMEHCAKFSKDGSIHYLCIDWRHVRTMMQASDGIYEELKNLCVWNKTNGGNGSLYRSKHELVLVYKHGSAPHTNHVALGANGRYRTNVWDYAGANAFGATRDRDLADHPTVKPIQLVADAMRDCSDRGDIVLDPFIGSGTTILAAERTRRLGFGLEIDPHYVDVAVGRWEALTGKLATLDGDGRTFAKVKADRERVPHGSSAIEELAR